MTEAKEHEPRDHISVPPVVFYLLLGAAGLGGGGLYGVLGPQLEKNAISQCFDNSKTALTVAAQHGEELVDIRRLLYEVRREIYPNTQSQRDWAEQSKRDESQERRLAAIERHVDTEIKHDH